MPMAMHALLALQLAMSHIQIFIIIIIPCKIMTCCRHCESVSPPCMQLCIIIYGEKRIITMSSPSSLPQAPSYKMPQCCIMWALLSMASSDGDLHYPSAKGGKIIGWLYNY